MSLSDPVPTITVQVKPDKSPVKLFVDYVDESNWRAGARAPRLRTTFLASR